MDLDWNANAPHDPKRMAAAKEEEEESVSMPKFKCPESPIIITAAAAAAAMEPQGAYDSAVKHAHTDYIVTGGAGFIGHHMVRFLLAQEPQSTILVLDDLSRGSLEHLPLEEPRLSFVEVDLHDRVQTARWVNNTKTVIHLADIVAGIDYVFSHQHAVFRSNMLINMNVLEACLKNDIKNYLYVGTACSFPLHFQSSYEIVALSENQTYPAMPESSYGWSKLMGEYEASLIMPNAKLNIGINRLHNVYGPGMVYGKTGSQIIPSLIRKAIDCLSGAGEFEVWGSGQQYRDFIHVSDVVNGIWLTLQHGMNEGVIQLGTGRGVSVHSVASEIDKLSRRVFGHSCRIQWNSEMPEGDKGRVADFSKATRVLGWKPQVRFEDGLVGTFSWIAKKMSRTEAQGHADALRYPSMNLIIDNATFWERMAKMERTSTTSVNEKRPSTRNKVLVIIIGQPRGGDIAWSSLQRQVLDVLPADLAILASGPLPPSLESMARYIWQIPEYDDWATPFEEMRCGSDWKKICNLSGIVLGGINSCGQNNGAGSGGILLAMRAMVFRELTTLLHNSKNNNEDKRRISDLYEHFILTRADHVYGCAHPRPPADVNAALIPSGEDYGGITDRHIMAPREIFLTAINASAIICDGSKWARILIERSSNYNLESILSLFFAESGLKIIRFPRNMFSIRVDGDPTRWSQGSDVNGLQARFGLLIKYPSELSETESTCGKNKIELIEQYAPEPL